VTGHVGLFQRLHRANSELVCRRSNLAGHWARIGVVGALRAVWRAGSIILAGIIKQTPDGIPMCEIADRHLTWITTRSNPSEVVRPPGFHVDKSGRRKHMKFRNQAFLFTPAVLLAWFLLAAPVAAQFAQQGTKLIGTGAIGDASQGWSASLSYDGNTAIVGGIGDSGVGAAWVFTRSGGVWSQQAKLVGTGSIGGEVAQGISVSLSGDGNTALVGGPYDNNFVGAAWVFTRSGGVWSQQAKLVGTGSIGPGSVFQGWSGSLSRDGNTALVGGYGDNGLIGAAWVYTRSGGVWSQQAKLVGTGNGAFSAQGVSASLSGDGTRLVGLMTAICMGVYPL